MNQENFNEAIINAKTASANGNYKTALNWYHNALKENPEDLEALSEAGTVCVAMEKFDEAFEHFQKAMEIDPNNGDNAFNLGNAYFFHGDYGKALELYSEAEMKECSEDVRQRIYYQIAMLCSINQDVKSALLNFQKYEEADKTGKAGLDPDIISEKIKLYMMIEDYEGASKYAVQWISMSPGEIRSYMVYFGILMAQGDYSKAEEIIEEAEKYAELTDNIHFNIKIEKIALLVAQSEVSVEKSNEYLKKAYDQLIELRQNSPESRQEELTLTFAEVCMKIGHYDEAIKEASSLLSNENMTEYTVNIHAPEYERMDESQIEEMLENDIQTVSDKIASGEINEEITESVDVYYDEDGNPVREYPAELFSDIEENSIDENNFDEEVQSGDISESSDKTKDFYDRVYFVLLSCYAAIEDYENAYKFGGILKHSENEYYSYFGRYTETFSMRELTVFPRETTDQKYSEVIAYFRSQMLAKPGNSFAVVFRARMYAEIGKFAKAEEMANLLVSAEKNAVMEYIDQCRKEYQNM